MLFVGVLAVSSLAVAQPGDREAALSRLRERFERGEENYASDDLALALDDFRAVYEGLTELQHPNAALVQFNIARCFAGLGQVRDAIAAYERFLAEADADAEYRQEARSELRELRARMRLHDGPAGRAPPDERIDSGGFSPVGFVVGGVGVVALVAGAFTGGFALAADADATRDCVDARCPADLGPKADEAHLLANVTDALLFGGLALAAVGIVLILALPGDDGSSATSLSLRPSGLSLTGRF